MHQIFKAFTSFVTVSALAAAFPACSSDDHDHTHDDGEEHLDFCALPKPCQDIVLACHPKDDGTPGTDVHECHETAHDIGTESACAKAHDDCIATCNAAPSLEGGAAEELNYDCGDAG